MSASALHTRIHAHLDAWRARDCLQGSVALALPGAGPQAAPLLASGGLADPAHGLPNVATTRFRLGSLSKSFTAAAVLQQVQAGRLALDTPLVRFFPRFPWAREITVLHLLQHRAGLSNYTAAPDYWGQRMRLPHSPTQLLDWLHELAPLAPPGALEAYSNGGYVLLAAIVEQLTQRDFASYRRERLFEPLELDSLAADDGRCVLEGAARGRVYDAGWRYAEALDMGLAWGAFDLVGSALDVLRWLQALDAGRVLAPGGRALMLDVEHRSLACGFSAGHWRLGAQSWRLPQHFGDVNGFFAYMSLLPQGGAVVVLANAFGLPVERLARELAQLSMGEEGLPLLCAEAPQAQALDPGFAPGHYLAEDGCSLDLLEGGPGQGLLLRSRRRYGLAMRYPLRAAAVADQALSRVLPERLELQIDGSLRWCDAEGQWRRLLRQPERV